jgi:hypothetical protein
MRREAVPNDSWNWADHSLKKRALTELPARPALLRRSQQLLEIALKGVQTPQPFRRGFHDVFF